MGPSPEHPEASIPAFYSELGNTAIIAAGVCEIYALATTAYALFHLSEAGTRSMAEASFWTSIAALGLAAFGAGFKYVGNKRS